VIARGLRRVGLAFAFALLPALAGAQASGAGAPATTPHNEPFVLGAVLRIAARSLGSDPIVGRVDTLRGEWVVLDTVAPRMDGGLFQDNIVPVDQYRFVAIRAQDIRTVDVRTGTSKVGGMVRYGLIGVGVGGLVGALSNGQGINPSGADFASGFVIGGIAGGIIGGTLGYLSGKDSWQRVPPPYYLNAPR
jgi:hypothetical protein